MARGILGKMVKGAAAVGVPALLEKAKNDQLAKRELTLQNLQQQYRREDQAFTAGQNALERDQRSADSAANRDLQQQELGLRREDQAAGRQIQGEQLNLEREKLDLTAQQMAQTLESGQLDVAEKRRLQGLYDVIANPEAAQEEISRAINVINGLKGNSPEKYSAITLYGDENEMGVQSRSTGILNQATGQIIPTSVSPGSSSSVVEADILRVMEANPQATRDQAIRYLQTIKPQ